jgi:branched-chain amino acid transport system substrate-binding protein
MAKTKSASAAKRLARRDFLKTSAGAAAFASFGIARKAFAAETVNIGGLYPVTGSFAQIGQACVNAAKLAVEMVNEAGGIKSLGGAKLNLIISDVQSDTTVTRTETDRLISGNRLSAIHGCYARP